VGFFNFRANIVKSKILEFFFNFLGKCVKFGHMLIFHAYIFGQKCFTPRLTELIRLYACTGYFETNVYVFVQLCGYPILQGIN